MDDLNTGRTSDTQAPHKAWALKKIFPNSLAVAATALSLIASTAKAEIEPASEAATVAIQNFDMSPSTLEVSLRNTNAPDPQQVPQTFHSTTTSSPFTIAKENNQNWGEASVFFQFKHDVTGAPGLVGQNYDFNYKLTAQLYDIHDNPIGVPTIILDYNGEAWTFDESTSWVTSTKFGDAADQLEYKMSIPASPSADLQYKLALTQDLSVQNLNLNTGILPVDGYSSHNINTATFTPNIPETSVATLSMLSAAGLLLRRRREAGETSV